MTADELEARIEKLVAEAREAGMEKVIVIDVLHDVVQTLLEEEQP
jgi:ATP-dependent Clp protease ATP-binding subunit ClpA